MSDTKFTINLDFKGRNDLEKIIEQIGREHNIPVNVDISKAKIGILQNLNKPFNAAYEGVRQFTSQLGLAISGVQQIYGALDRTIGSFVRAAQDAESADMALKGSFRATGLEVEGNAQKMSQYAAQLQKTTVYEDDMLKRQMAQMQNIGRFDNTATLMGATKAAIGLSAAFGIDLATAMDLVGKAAAGNTSMLGRYGIVLNETASQAEKMSQLISIGTGYFKLAEDQAGTSAGSVAQLKNAWGDLQEVLAEGVLPVITKLSTALKPLVEFASSMGSDQKAMTMGLIILNALVVKHTLAIMGQRAAFAALTVEQQHQVMSMMLLIGAQTGGTTSSLAFSLGMKSLGASVAAAGTAVKGFLASIGPVGWIIIGITAAYAGLNAVLKVNTEVMKNKYAAERESLEQKKEAIAKSQEEEKGVLKLAERYQQLAGQSKRNRTEQQELSSIHQQLASKYPNLISATGNYKTSLEGVKSAAEKAKKALADLGKQQWQTEISLAKSNIESNRVETYSILAKDFNWRDIWFSAERGVALEGVKRDMQTLLNNDSSLLSDVFLENLAKRLEDLSKNSKDFRDEEQVALTKAATQVRIMIANRQRYNELLREGIPKEVDSPGAGGGPGKDSDDMGKDSILKRLDDYRIMQEAAFDAEKADKAMRKRQYEDDLKLVEGIGDNAKAKKLLLDEYNADIVKIEEKYRTEREDKEKQHYEQLKFMDSGYYEWKKGQLEAESKKLFPEKEGDRKAWLGSQTAELDKEKADWENKPYADFESQYEANMGHLSELQQLGLITYEEIARAAWSYYEALKAIIEADGEITADEQEMLDKFRKRANKAQLTVNRDSDVASYYNQVKFLDSSYYEWKKARIKEDVDDMQISEDQKAKILKQALDQLEDEQTQDTLSVKPLFKLFGMDKNTQDSVVQQYQMMANQISSIWNQMFANLDAQKDLSLRSLEKRAKNERKSEAWLASEKEKINEQYEKKVRSMKRIEQKMQIASGLMNTFEGVTNALTMKPAWLAPIMAASIGALGLANVGYIAAQKFAQGGSPKGLFHGKGTSTSDSNLIAISDEEYIIAADRVRRFGVSFFDALNFGDGKQIRNALSLVTLTPTMPQSNATPKSSFGAGGYASPPAPANQVIQVTLQCDSRVLAKAVAKGNKKIIRIN